MKTVERRISRLEHQFGTDGKPRMLYLACKAGWGLALDQDACMQILSQSGFLPTGLCGVVDLCKIPDGLNAHETERFLRENAAEICGFGVAASLTQERPGG